MADIRYSDCHLSIRIEDAEIAIALQDRQSFHVRNHQVFPLEHGLEDHAALKKALESLKPMATAQTISCSFNLSGNTLIPESVFRENFELQYLSFNFEPEKGQTIANDDISLMETRNVYTLPNIHSTINAAFPQCRFLHESSIEIELVLRLSRTSKKNAAYLFFSGKFFRLLVIRDGKLQLANTFQYGSEMDVAYYVLYVFDQLGVKSSETSTHVAGAIEENGAELNMLREYIGPVQLLRESPLADLQFKPQHPAETHRMFTLLHQVLCAS